MNTLAPLRSGKLAGSRRLSLSCGLESFPPEIYTLADTLEVLDLSGNRLSALPHDLTRLRKLRTVFCSYNRFTELPAVLGQCATLHTIGFRANQISSVVAEALPLQLRSLVLTDNQLRTVPTGIGRCTGLRKLMLTGNQLHDLPAELAGCTQLELLRIASNRFAVLPLVLFDLPRLAWLAFAGNPVSDAAQPAAATPAGAGIPWASLQLQHQLGEGASGVIYQALWQQAGNAAAGDAVQRVAVKIFKGNISSDGLPRSEMAACLHAGNHPNLIPVHGPVIDHPDGASGLVMALVDTRFKNLAGPPSLDSCTRDVYDADARISLDAVLRIAQGVAAAAAHLHARGLVHGDLYAHNILHSDDGTAMLGDFGAASFFPAGNGGAAQAQALQRIEMRAFSHLLGELLARCGAPAANRRAAWQAVLQLQADCASGTPVNGSGLGAISKQLAALA